MTRELHYSSEAPGSLSPTTLNVADHKASIDLLIQAWKEFVDRHRDLLDAESEAVGRMFREGDTEQLTAYANRFAGERADAAVARISKLASPVPGTRGQQAMTISSEFTNRVAKVLVAVMQDDTTDRDVEAEYAAHLAAVLRDDPVIAAMLRVVDAAIKPQTFESEYALAKAIEDCQRIAAEENPDA